MFLGTWGTNWTCCDKCCRCDCCWDAGEYDPNNRPGEGVIKKEGQQQQKVDQTEENGNAPPAYKPTDPMTINPNNEGQVTPITDGSNVEQTSLTNDPTLASQPQTAISTASNAGRTQTGIA